MLQGARRLFLQTVSKDQGCGQGMPFRGVKGLKPWVHRKNVKEKGGPRGFRGVQGFKGSHKGVRNVPSCPKFNENVRMGPQE